MKSIVLGVGGSVAAYRACDLARDLMRAGFTVRACLTDSAAEFVQPALFEALTGQPCLVSAFDEPERGKMAHIDWAREASVLVIAPATANLLAKLAHGVADDMLTTIAVAYDGPIVVAPAMNPTMFASESVQSALKTLQDRGVHVVEPGLGEVACGEQGQGKLASNAEILSAVLAVSTLSETLKRQRVLITSGPTQEPLDDVRYLTNRSSGKMGAALAKAALLLGAEVTVVAGPSSVIYPARATVIRVKTAEEMLQAAKVQVPNADWIIGAAAVADYRPVNKVAGKMRRTAENLSIELTPNPDVLAELSKVAQQGCRVIGFAAEPSTDLEAAREKMARKKLEAIAHNDVSKVGLGFESDANALTLLHLNGDVAESGVMSKLECALWLFDQMVKRGGSS